MAANIYTKESAQQLLASLATEDLNTLGVPLIRKLLLALSKSAEGNKGAILTRLREEKMRIRVGERDAHPDGVEPAERLAVGPQPQPEDGAEVRDAGLANGSAAASMVVDRTAVRPVASDRRKRRAAEASEEESGADSSDMDERTARKVQRRLHRSLEEMFPRGVPAQQDPTKVSAAPTAVASSVQEQVLGVLSTDARRWPRLQLTGNRARMYDSIVEMGRALDGVKGPGLSPVQVQHLSRMEETMARTGARLVLEEEGGEAAAQQLDATFKGTFMESVSTQYTEARKRAARVPYHSGLLGGAATTANAVPGTRQVTATPFRPRDGPLVCYSCGHPGHTARVCPARTSGTTGGPGSGAGSRR